MITDTDRQQFIQLRKKVLEAEFQRLNPQQKQAVFRINGPLLVLEPVQERHRSLSTGSHI
jgi:hypothetical protein